MTIALAKRGVRGIVLDIEGTTTPISFVYDVLFPYARRHLRAYLHANRGSDSLARAIWMLQDEWPPVSRAQRDPLDLDFPPGTDSDSLAAYLERLMDQDVKSPGLKLVQGEIWKVGYAEGELRGEVFPDVPPALARWHAAGLALAIYSSGSVLAQRLIFGTTPHGDLTRFIGHFFDTDVGAKREAPSYRRISEAIGRTASELIFISDVSQELDAARAAGMQTLLCVRPGNPAQSSAETIVRSFDEIAA